MATRTSLPGPHRFDGDADLVFDDAGFDALERDYVRRKRPDFDFDWVRFDWPSPRHRLRVPLSRARVALVTTAGAHLPGEDPFRLDGEVRFVALDRALALTHVGYDTERAARDPDVVVPVGALRRLAARGIIGSLAPTLVSTMGLVPRGHDVLERTAPLVADRLSAEEVDLALLVPA